MTAPDDPRDAYRATLPYLREWLAYRAWRDRLPGLQVAIGFDDEILLSDAWGWADVEAARPLGVRSLFRIASHSKTFTATALLQLAERGELRLDDPVGRHVAALAGSPLAEATIRELMEHGGGVLRDGLDSDHWAIRHPFPDEEGLLALVRDGGAKAPMGATFAYSNLGYSLLGLVIESVTGRSYAEQVRAAILEPLGLEDTGPDWDEARADEFVVGYTSLDTARVRTRLPHVAARAMASATGFFGTAEDLVRYFSAHVLGRGSLLSDRSKRVAQRRAWNAKPDDPTGPGYGMGFGVDRIGGRGVVGHSGGYPGHTTRTYVDPVSSLVVSVAVSVTGGPADAIARGILGLLDAAADPGGDPAQAVGDAAPGDLDGMTGRFANPWGVTDLARVGDRIRALDPASLAPADSTTRVRVLDGDTLLITDGEGYGSVGEHIRYERDTRGGIERIRYAGARLDPWRIPDEPPEVAAGLV